MKIVLKPFPLPPHLRPSPTPNPNHCRHHHLLRRQVTASKMKAVTVSNSGELSLVEVDDPPAIGDGEVLIKVAATALNRGEVPIGRAYDPPKGSSPYPGLECSGVIIDVGRALGRWKIGDQVCALLNGGGYAEKVVVPAGQVLPLPRGVSLKDAASLPEASCTVWSTIFMMSGLSNGETFLVMAQSLDPSILCKDIIQSNITWRSKAMLDKNRGALVYLEALDRSSQELLDHVLNSLQIHGGSSGIGTLAIQVASCRGARVFATAGTEEKLAFCKHLGADVCINYRTEDFAARVKEETQGNGVDVILDYIGGSYFQRNLDSLTTDGRLFVIGCMEGIIADVNLSCLLDRRLTIQAARLRHRSPESKAEIVGEVEKNVWPAIESGTVKPVVYKCFPLSEAAEAHRMMESGAHIGKILLVP